MERHPFHCHSQQLLHNVLLIVPMKCFCFLTKHSTIRLVAHAAMQKTNDSNHFQFSNFPALLNIITSTSTFNSVLLSWAVWSRVDKQRVSLFHLSLCCVWSMRTMKFSSLEKLHLLLPMLFWPFATFATTTL